MLDPKGKSDIKWLIDEMRKVNPNLTILSITHDVEEAYLSDQVLVLNKGEIAFKGKPEEVFKNRSALESLHLEMPFVLNLKEKLNLSDESQTLDEIAEELWP